ncbi:4'-phosphopantetheinyl transferase family protein [Streptomyces sp. NPDC096132]|uniref:4'-phosphopantetheinyl transferase family protein n=1 Tax=Streptomyces sp. NPDC096132 TaxID=3366075 RepID=UPI0037F5C20F
MPVEVSWARLGDAHDGLRSLLDPVERARLDATPDPATRGRFLVGCALSRLLLGELLGMPPADVPLRRVCPRCGGPHGKPRLDAPAGSAAYDFSVTHSGALIGVAVCAGAEVGLDVEDADAALDVDSAARIALSARESAILRSLPPADRKPAFLRIWTRKEAVLKALGVGLHMPLHALEMSPPEAPPTVLAWPDHPAAVRRELHLADMVVDGVHPAVVAVAVPRTGSGAGVGPTGVRVTEHDRSGAVSSYGRLG